MTNALSFEVNKTAAWRVQKQERHPQDSRNQTARILLARLAEQDANADLTRRYETLQEDEEISTERLGQAHSEVLGEIGFRWVPKHVDEVLERIINRVTGKAPTLADLMDVHRAHADDDAAKTAAGRPVNQ